MKNKNYCDGLDTSEKWQLNESGIVFWPIGAFEQHGHHLPLITDSISAEYYAKELANKFSACLLPVQHYGTSLEHKGFRGTITLTPDLMMALVKNMANELEAQNFKYLIIINGHGGNFSLAPVVREINREDRNIKILLVSPYMSGKKKTGEPEIHAGKSETSIILAMDKNLVGHDRRDENPFFAEETHLQSDLNHYGVGRISQSGVWGKPSDANSKLGKELIKHALDYCVDHIKEKMKIINKDRRYGGAGPVALRPMKDNDIDLGMSLKEAAHWNQTQMDWELLQNISHKSHWVALHNGKRVGTTSVVHYKDKFSWLGMVLVDPSIRRCGIGSKLLHKAIKEAQKNGTVKLDATPEGKMLYQTLGFKDECQLARMEIFNYQGLDKGTKTNKILNKDLSAIAKFDSAIFGSNRKEILEGFRKISPNYAFAKKEKKAINGFCLGRKGSNFEQIGPIIANDNSTAKNLTLNALQNCIGQNVIIDIFLDQKEFKKFLEEIGFQIQRPFTRMYLGKKIKTKNIQKQFAIAGPEWG